jgi:hypothetical protein
VRALAKRTGLSQDEAVAVNEAMLKSSIPAGGNSLKLFGERAIARFFGVKLRSARLPESLLQRNDGKFLAVEVKNQNEPNVGETVAKFRSANQLVTRRFGRFQMGRFELYVKKGFRAFDDKSYTVGRDGKLLFNGTPQEIDGVPIFVIERDLGPPRED